MRQNKTEEWVWKGDIPAPNYTQIPNIIPDEIIRHITGSESKLMWIFSRQILGWHKDGDSIAISQMIEMTGMCKQTVIDAIKSLEHKKIIEATRSKDDSGVNLENYYRLIIFDEKEGEQYDADSIPQRQGGSLKNRQGGSLKNRQGGSLKNRHTKETEERNYTKENVTLEQTEKQEDVSSSERDRSGSSVVSDFVEESYSYPNGIEFLPEEYFTGKLQSIKDIKPIEYEGFIAVCLERYPTWIDHLERASTTARNPVPHKVGILINWLKGSGTPGTNVNTSPAAPQGTTDVSRFNPTGNTPPSFAAPPRQPEKARSDFDEGNLPAHYYQTRDNLKRQREESEQAAIKERETKQLTPQMKRILNRTKQTTQSAEPVQSLQ
jgi:phage replication O-like protein O